jgi:hypothetical protein
MGEHVRVGQHRWRRLNLAEFRGFPLPSALLIVAGLLNGILWGLAAFVVHIVLKRYIYREYRSLPYPMPTSSRPMDDLERAAA